ncbi:MAG: SPOR domain-containing protein [Gemmatimonadales bacterium]|nr:SPOR domain-containing protein [Gemmatimonadales bacterium]
MNGNDGKGKRIRRAWRTLAARTLFCLPVLAVFPVLPALAQTDPRLVDIIRQAQEGRGDSARTKARRLLAATSPTDTLYPQIIYTQAMVASDANEMRRQLQRVAVEYSTASWADDALLRLVQLDYASGNLEGAARNLERIRLDYPDSPLLPQTSYWAARTYFDQKAPEQACRWIADGLAQSRSNVELQNQLGYLDQRCAGIRAEIAARPPIDSQPGLASGGTDTAALPPEQAEPVPTPPPSNPTPVATAPAPTPDEPAPAPARPEPPAPAKTSPEPAAVASRPAQTTGRFRVQVTAVRVPATAQALADRLRKQGLTPVIVQEAGLHKVRVGDYATRPEAAAALPDLKAKLGGSLFVVAEP